MDGHIDAVSCMAKNPNYLKGIFSGSMDGGISKYLVFLRLLCDLIYHLNLTLRIVCFNFFFLLKISMIFLIFHCFWDVCRYSPLGYS
jgi:hypothetical protein